MILNCKDPFNHSYTNLTVCVLPLLSSPLTVSVVVVACIKYSHRDRVSFSLSLRSRPYVGTSPDPSPGNGSAAALQLSLRFGGRSRLRCGVLAPGCSPSSFPVHPENPSQGVPARFCASRLHCTVRVRSQYTLPPCSMELQRLPGATVRSALVQRTLL